MSRTVPILSTEHFGLFADEIGLTTLVRANKDAHIIILLRMIRLIGFGGTSLILALFLKEIRFNAQFIGLFMTATFVGDLVTSFGLSVFADTLGRKNVLVLSSLIMTLTGACFVWVENHYMLTIVAALGIVTPSGGEVGPFRSIEQSSIASLVPHEERSDIYAWYTFLGSFSAALGSMLWGHIVDISNKNWGYSLAASYKMAFLAYTILSLVTLLLSLGLGDGIEWTTEVKKKNPEENVNDAVAVVAAEATTPTTPNEVDETSRLLDNDEEQSSDSPVTNFKKQSKHFRLLPHLQPSIYSIVIKLSLLFALDSFASSLVPLSWQSYYIKQKFQVSASYLGSVFFTTGIISGFTSLLGTSLTKRLGPVVTMVVTHLPASILLGFVPLPLSLFVTMAILVIRASTQSMDVAPKHVFLATLVPSESRTAIFGWVNVVKTLAQVVGPSIVGYLTSRGTQWITFVIASALKASYDLGILFTFLTFNRHSEH